MSRKVSSLPSAGTLTGNEIFYLIQSSSDRKVTLSTIISYINPVTSVNGKTGASVTLSASDIGALASGANVSLLVNDANYLVNTRSISTQHSITGGGNLTSDRTLNLVGDTAAPGNNKFYGTDGSGNRGWYNAATIGSANQIPVSNSLGTGFDYSATFTRDLTNNNFVSGSSISVSGSGTMNNNIYMGASHSVSGGVANIRWTILLGESGTVTNLGVAGKRIHNCSAIGGTSNTIRNDAAGQELFSCMIFNGNSNIIEATSAQTTSCTIIGGRNNYIANVGVAYAGRYKGRATGHGAIALGFATTYNGTTSHTGSVQDVLASGRAAINISANSDSSVVGEGALADYCGHFAGIDSNTPTTSPRSVILGGNGLKMPDNRPDAVLMTHLIVNSSSDFKVAVTSAGTLTLDRTATTYIFSGTTSTWTLPVITTTTNQLYFIKNRGSGNITVNSASSNEIYDTSVVSSFTIFPGESYMIQNDGTYWNLFFNGLSYASL